MARQGFCYRTGKRKDLTHGTPKFLLLVDGQPLISHIVAVLGRDFGQAIVVGTPTGEFSKLRVEFVHGRKNVPAV